MTIDLISLNCLVWRIMFADQRKQVCEPVKSPVGRFHYGGQVALYTSCSKEGAKVAIKRYINSDDPDRIIVPLDVTAERIYDIRKTNYSKSASVVWQDHHTRGERAPTWEYSDAARKAGAQGMLYASRTRPELTHLVLFDVSESVVKQGGDCQPWRHDDN